jgi:hypothetical protein
MKCSILIFKYKDSIILKAGFFLLTNTPHWGRGDKLASVEGRKAVYEFGELL